MNSTSTKSALSTSKRGKRKKSVAFADHDEILHLPPDQSPEQNQPKVNQSMPLQRDFSIPAIIPQHSHHGYPAKPSPMMSSSPDPMTAKKRRWGKGSGIQE